MNRMKRKTTRAPATTLALLALLATPLALTSTEAQDAPQSDSSPCPGEMAAVPGGTFRMGSTDGDPDERPVHEVTITGFCIDRTEVTVEGYRRCVAAQSCRPAQDDDLDHTADGHEESRDAPAALHPINGVSWDDAQAFCAWRGARLPTEAEWEYAARGSDGRAFPWGNERPTSENLLASSQIECNRPPCGRTQPVGQRNEGASPFGALDMAGNVWEWVADWYGPYRATPERDPSGPGSGTHRVLRGGGFDMSRGDALRSANRSRGPQSSRSPFVGFRCARPIEPSG